MPLTLALSMLIFLSGAFEITADVRHRRQWVYLLKPLTTALVICLALAGVLRSPSAYGILILIGLTLSLVGDVFLMLPEDRFLAGLGAFLAAHIAYTTAFVQGALVWGPLYAVLPFALILAGMLRLLWPHTGAMRLPVTFYALVILMMAWRAWVRWGTLGGTAALFAALGAALFVASDSFLAYNRFVKALPWAPIWVMSTYYAAQWLIALSIGR